MVFRLSFLVFILLISGKVSSQQKSLVVSFNKTPAIEMDINGFLRIDSLSISNKDYKVNSFTLVLEYNDSITPVRFRQYGFNSLKYLRSDLAEWIKSCKNCVLTLDEIIVEDLKGNRKYTQPMTIKLL